MNPLKSEIEDSQDWLVDTLKGIQDSIIGVQEPELYPQDNADDVAEAAKTIREHFLKEALGLLGQDEAENLEKASGRYLEIRGANRLRKQLRNKFNDKYKGE